MKFRLTTKEDITQVMTIINQAIQYFKENNINQWQDGYPNKDTILQDIKNNEAYVLEENGNIVATCMITINGEPTYNQIDGAWLSDTDYICVHRIALNNKYKGQGVASIVLENAIKLYPNYHDIRLDTHHDNLSMQRFLTKNGFAYCGIITLMSGDKRKAYQKLLKEC